MNLLPLDVAPHWLSLAGAAVLVVCSSIAGYYLLFWSVRKLVGIESRTEGSLYRRIDRFLLSAMALFACALLVRLPVHSSSTRATLDHFTIAAFAFLAGWMALIATDVVIERYLQKIRRDADNLGARKIVTQMEVLKKALRAAFSIITVGMALLPFDNVRNYGVSIFASAGLAGIAVGFAAKPLLGNLIAGIQIALTQPIRIDDAVIVEDEWGWVEELNSTYIVIRLWDWRRMIVPLAYFLEHPFQNWTRTSASLIGSVFFHLDYRAPIPIIRSKLIELVQQSEYWDRQVVNLQVTSTTEQTIEARALMSARNSSGVWDLRCEIREKMLDFLQREHPEVLPRIRLNVPGSIMEQ